MSRICRHPLLVLALLVLALTGGRASAASELTKVHVLLVFDTTSDLKDQLVRDQKRVGRLLRNNLPPKLVEVKTLIGREATREKILAYYRSVPVSADEGLVFFYGGHGAMDPKKGHYLQLQNGKKGAELIRADLRKAMEARKPGLVVILTDCCSNTRKVAKRQLENQEEKVTPRGVFHPTMKALLYQARGTVDITAATGTVSWGDDDNGGLFTRSLCKMLTTSLSMLKGGKEGVLTWQEFFPKLRRDTETTFRSWAAEMRRLNPGDKIDSRTQTPQAFVLPKQGNNNSKAWAVVSLSNEMKRPLRYQVRWSTQSRWESKVLAPGAKTVHVLPLAKADTEVYLEAKMEGIAGTKVQKMKVNHHTGDSKPGFGDGFPYRVRTRVASRVSRRDARPASASADNQIDADEAVAPAE
jgi:hypothetical protein